MPKLSEEQARDALSVIPTDYWGFNCWTCKNAGHSTFTCPTLTPEQRIYYAYCYFLYKCKDNPKRGFANALILEWHAPRPEARTSTGTKVQPTVLLGMVFAKPVPTLGARIAIRETAVSDSTGRWSLRHDARLR